MEEKIPFSFRNPANPTSHKTTTVSTMNTEDFVVSLSKEMDLIMQTMEPKPQIMVDNFNGSPNFNQSINNHLRQSSESKKPGEKPIFMENDSFGGADHEKITMQIPFEIKDLSKNFKDSIDREKFAEVLGKNYELKLKTKDLENKLSSLITELSECQKSFETILKIPIATSISEELHRLATDHNSLKNDLECLEDENEKLGTELAQKAKRETELLSEIEKKSEELEKSRKAYSEELGKVNKLIEMNTEMNAEIEKTRKENEEKFNGLLKSLEEYKSLLERKDRSRDEMKSSHEKTVRSLEKSIRELNEGQYRADRSLRLNDLELKEKCQAIEQLKVELQDALSLNREERQRSEDYLERIAKAQNFQENVFKEFSELNKDIIKELVGTPGAEEYFSQEFISLMQSDDSQDPLHSIKDLLIVSCKEIQNLVNKLLGFSGYMEKCTEEFESKREAIEDKWLQKYRVISEERDYLHELFSKTCQRIKNERFSEIVSKLLASKNEAMTQELELKMREAEFYSLETNLKRQLGEKNLKPELIIQFRSELEKKKAQLIFLKKNFLKSKEEISYLEEEFESFRNENFNFSLERKTSMNVHTRKVSLSQNERPERLSLKEKLDKSRRLLINSPTK